VGGWRLVPALALGVLVTGCSAVQEYLGGEDNDEPPAELVEFTPEIEIETLWSRDVGSGVDEQYLKLRPTVVGGRVYAAGRDGDVAAYDALTGDLVWEQQTDVPISGGPGIGEGLVLVGTSEAGVVALWAETGEPAWRTRVSSEVLATPAAAGGVVVVRTGDGKLFGLSRDSGKRIWVYDRTVPVLTLRGTSSPVTAGDTVLAGFDSGRLVSVSLRDGQPVWEARVAVPRGRSELERMVDIDGDPVVADREVYVATFQGDVAAVDLGTGRVLWRRDMSSHVGVGVGARNVYVTDEMSHIWALDRSSSASLWRQQRLQARGVTSPVVFGDYLVVGDLEGYVHWLRREDGQFVGRHQAGDGFIAPPVATDEAVYLYDRGGRLTAVRPR
jgi:outer membrane protein assembly factor BamB